MPLFTFGSIWNENEHETEYFFREIPEEYECENYSEEKIRTALSKGANILKLKAKKADDYDAEYDLNLFFIKTKDVDNDYLDALYALLDKFIIAEGGQYAIIPFMKNKLFNLGYDKAVEELENHSKERIKELMAEINRYEVTLKVLAKSDKLFRKFPKLYYNDNRETDTYIRYIGRYLRYFNDVRDGEEIEEEDIVEKLTKSAKIIKMFKNSRNKQHRDLSVVLDDSMFYKYL